MGNQYNKPHTPKIESSEPPLTIRPYTQVKNGRPYHSFLVQGWKINGKWQRRKFKHRDDAERFVALHRINQDLLNPLQIQASRLNSQQIDDAEQAFIRLGNDYSLRQAVDFFLNHHRDPEFTINLDEAVRVYITSRIGDGTRERTLKQSENVLKLFIQAVTVLPISEVTHQMVHSYLSSLKSRDGKSQAKRKTWNNYRNDLNQFFEWATKPDLSTHRPWVFINPVKDIIHYTSKQVAEQKSEIATTSVDQVKRLMQGLTEWKGGKMVKYYALAYFAGIRPEGELTKLSPREKELINLKTGIITIPASISKTKVSRQIHITPNLRSWLLAYEGYPIIPKNVQKLRKIVKGAYNITHDETRHSYISYHIGLHRSIGDAALQAGNSESIIKKHYLNLQSKEDSKQFFETNPKKEDTTTKEQDIMCSA